MQSNMNGMDFGWGMRSITPRKNLFKIDTYHPSAEAKRRLKWMEYYELHKNAAQACRHFDIPLKSFWKWRKRFLEEGLVGLEDQIRRPEHTRQRETPQRTIDFICRIRETNPCFSKYKIAAALNYEYGIALSASSVGRVLKDYGFILPRDTKRRKKAALSPVRRISNKIKRSIKQPGDLVHVDTKHLYLVGGRRVFHFTAIDALSRFKFAWVHSTITSASSARFLDQAFSYFPFEVRAMVSDNGSEYKGKFDQRLQELHIDHYFIYPHSPKQNGIVERAIRTDIEEFYHHGGLEENIEQQNKRIAQWNEYYNYKRYHRSLGCLTPAQYLATLNLPNRHLYPEP